MADYNRRQRGNYRTSSQDWNQRNEGSMREEGHQGSGGNLARRYGRYEGDDWNQERSSYGSGGHGYSNPGSRFERGYDDSGSSSRSRFDREDGFNRGRNYDDNRGRFGQAYRRNFDSGYEPHDNSDRWDERRDLYDRDYEGYSPRGRYGLEGYGNFGAGNYGSYGSSYGGYSGSHYGGNQDSNYGRRNRNRSGESLNERDRGWRDRTSDEVASWFGDDDAERRRPVDRQNRGMFRGRGPRSYRRSDERIKEDINDRLSDDPFIDATDIEVMVSMGEVTLTGIVDDRDNKRRAEDIAEDVSGVKNVENRLRIRQTTESAQERSSSASSPMATERGKKKERESSIAQT